MTDARVKLTLDCSAPVPTLQELKDLVETVLRERNEPANDQLVSAFVVLLALLHAVNSGIQDGEGSDVAASLQEYLGDLKLFIHKPGSGYEICVGSDKLPMVPYRIRTRLIYGLLDSDLVGAFFRYVQEVRAGTRAPIWSEQVEISLPKARGISSTLCRWQDEAVRAGLIDPSLRRESSGRATVAKLSTGKVYDPPVNRPVVRVRESRPRETTEVWLRHTSPAGVLTRLDKVLKSGLFAEQTKPTRAALAAALLAAYAWENRRTESAIELAEACITALLGEGKHLWIEVSPTDQELQLVVANGGAWESTISVDVGGQLVKNVIHPGTRRLLADLAYSVARMREEPTPEHVHGPTDRVRRTPRLLLLKAYLERPLRS